MTQVLKSKELLTDNKMKSLFGAEYKNIVYFNFDLGKWNRNNYLGFSMGNQNIDTNNAIEMRRVLELDGRLASFEVVAAVTMSVPDTVYPGNQNVVREVKYKRARNIVATVVLRDKNTGKIINNKRIWFGVDQYQKISIAAFYGADAFVYQIAQNAKVRDMFISNVVLNYQR